MKNVYTSYVWQPQSDREPGHLAIKEKFQAGPLERLLLLLFGIVSHEVVVMQMDEGEVEIHSEIHICLPSWMPVFMGQYLHPRVTVVRTTIVNTHEPQSMAHRRGAPSQYPL